MNNDYIEKSFGKNILGNLKIFFDEFFLEFLKYFILTEKCKLFIEKFFGDKFKGNLSDDLNKFLYLNYRNLYEIKN